MKSVVSTNQTTIANLRSALAALGYRVRASRNIAAGIKRFRLTSPDLLIIDAGLLERQVPESVVQRFHVWRRHGDHYHPHGPSAPSLAPASGPVPPTIGKLTLDPATLSVHIGDRVASLTPMKFAVFVTLMSHLGKVVTRDGLLDAVNHEVTVFERVVDRYICNIRHKIDVNPDSPSIIKTIRGIGYRIDP